MVRDVDSLDALPDSKISSLDKKYLVRLLVPLKLQRPRFQ